MTQAYSSKDTCINTVSAIYKVIQGKYSGRMILDYGGGKYDTNAKYMKENYNTTVLVYDPYNRSKEHNQKVVKHFLDHPAKCVVCSNVLNVIKEDEIIFDILQKIYRILAVNGELYIKVYERDKTGVGCLTPKGWQRNQKISEYVPYILRVFTGKCDIIRDKDVLIVKKLG